MANIGPAEWLWTVCYCERVWERINRTGQILVAIWEGFCFVAFTGWCYQTSIFFMSLRVYLPLLPSSFLTAKTPNCHILFMFCLSHPPFFLPLVLCPTTSPLSIRPLSPQLSLRRQQVSEKLNEWVVFNEKNKELCEWLTQMESKVSQNGDISIEEMIEKLRKVISAHILNWNKMRICRTEWTQYICTSRCLVITTRFKLTLPDLITAVHWLIYLPVLLT